MNQKNQNSNWKKILEFRNMQEKLENNVAYNIFTTVPVVFYHKEETYRGLQIKVKEIKTQVQSSFLKNVSFFVGSVDMYLQKIKIQF